MSTIQATGVASFFHVESPYVVRNLKDCLLKRKVEWMAYLRSADGWDAFNKTAGRLDGYDDVLEMLNELEKQERN